jgi:hypothetical protein
MIDVGVATSIAFDNQYSWQDTYDFAITNQLNSIQFYVTPDYRLPIISDFKHFKNIYLHLPIDYDVRVKDLMLFINNFVTKYHSKKLIIHQKEGLTFQKQASIIREYYENKLLVGVENEGQQDLGIFLDLIQFLNQTGIKFFVIVDIHRYFFNYIDKYEDKEIFLMILETLDYCKNNNLPIVLHVIDSMSFKGDRQDWIAILEGIVPYRQLFKTILKKKIDIESIIFEYENYQHVKKSLDNLKKFDYNIGK